MRINVRIVFRVATWRSRTVCFAYSLQPSAGVDIAEVKREYGNRLCLMGKPDLNELMTFGTPEQVAAQARWLCENIGQDGGHILSTCNILTNAIPAENARAMYGV